MKALAHNIKNFFNKLLGANKCCRNKKNKVNRENWNHVPSDPPSKASKANTTPIYRNKYGYPEDIGEFGCDDETRT